MKTPTPHTERPGRPKTGGTKIKCSVTIDRAINKSARRLAASEGIGLSTLIERLLRKEMT